MKIARGKLRNAIPCLLSLSPKDPNNRLRRLDLCLARRLRRLSCTVHFVFAKSYWFTLGFNDLLYRWRRAPKRTNISEKYCSHSRNIGRRCGEYDAGKRIRARASAFYLLFCHLAIYHCAYLAHYQRGHWAHAWVLSGYTAAIVGILAALAPNQAFSVIMSRAENVILGIVCMGAVSMIVFPETVSRSLIKLVQATDAKLSKFLPACLSLVSDYSGRNRALRKLTANALAIENLRHGFAFEEIGAGSGTLL